MPSKKQYNLVQNDENDTRIPLHPEEAFQHGITFQAKFIGSLDVPRPVSRVEIVAAMRRIRYEFKAKGIKKKKVTVEVSIDGVRVSLRKKKKKNQYMDENKMLLMHHPIYRIFYVSHDSQDLKIFSYIARDGASNVFKCNVFKSNKKSQAMRIVRTVGQAFEVCHKLSINIPASVDDEQDPLNDVEDGGSERGSEILSDQPKKAETSSDPISCETLPGDDSASTQDADGVVLSATPASQRPLRLDIVPPSPTANSNRRSSPLSGIDAYVSPLSEPPKASANEQMPNAGTLLSAHHEIQLLKEQLNQQSQQTQAAVAQVHLLRDQLAAETTARLEAQARTHQLLVHNKELLDHITALVAHLQEHERTQKPLQLGGQSVAMMPQYFCDPMYLPEVQDADQTFGENRNTVNQGQFVTAPSSPKQRQSAFFQGQQQQQGYSFMFPTPEQQFQAQLMQRLQSLTSYKNHPYSILPPSMYQPLPSGLYSFPNTFPHVKSYKSPPATKTASSVDVAAEDNVEKLEDEEDQPKPDSLPPGKKTTLSESHNSRSGGSSPATAGRKKGRLETEPMNIPQPAKAAASTQSPPKNQPQSPKSPYQNAFQSALSSLMALRVTGGSADRTKKQCQSNGPSYITRSTSEKVPNRSELMDQLSPTAKVFRWFKLVPPPTHPLSRPESGFVDGEKSQKDGDDDGMFRVEDVFDREAVLGRSLLHSLSSRKRKRLLKLQLGRMTTF